MTNNVPLSLCIIIILSLIIISFVIIFFARHSRVKIGGYDYLYHGSKHKLEHLMPQPSGVLHGEAAVFATPSREFALAFINYPAKSGIELGSFEKKLHLIEMRPEALEVMDSPGYLYLLDRANFHTDKRVGMPDHELVSKKPAKIITSEYIPSALKELEEYQHAGNLVIVRNDKVFKVRLAEKHWTKISKQDAYTITLPKNKRINIIDNNSILIMTNKDSRKIVAFVKNVISNDATVKHTEIKLGLKIWFVE